MRQDRQGLQIMNDQRRKTIKELRERVEAAQKIVEHAISELHSVSFEDFVGEAEELRDEEQDYLDNMPESLQGGEKGEKASEAINYLEEAHSAFEELVEAVDELGDKFSGIESAIKALANAETV
jgi:uncharacterized coiled-coil DUF342 family protein